MKQKSVRVLRKKLVKIFNQFIRERDQGKGCISCTHGPVEQAGHYYHAGCGGVYAPLAFDEKNVNGQCVKCNHFLRGNLPGYAQGLLKRYGKKILDELAIKKTFSRGTIWTVFEYESLIKTYQEKLKK